MIITWLICSIIVFSIDCFLGIKFELFDLDARHIDDESLLLNLFYLFLACLFFPVTAPVILVYGYLKYSSKKRN